MLLNVLFLKRSIKARTLHRLFDLGAQNFIMFNKYSLPTSLIKKLIYNYSRFNSTFTWWELYWCNIIITVSLQNVLTPTSEYCWSFLAPSPLYFLSNWISPPNHKRNKQTLFIVNIQKLSRFKKSRSRIN